MPAGRDWVMPVLGPGEPEVVLSGIGGPTWLYSARGVQATEEAIVSGPVLAAAKSPDGGGSHP